MVDALSSVVGDAHKGEVGAEMCSFFPGRSLFLGGLVSSPQKMANLRMPLNRNVFKEIPIKRSATIHTNRR